jgi:hypothetical protein
MKRILLRSLLLLLLVLLIAGGVVVWCAEWIFIQPPAHYDVSVGAIELLPPGTVVGDGAPDGWTHLILKSQPRLASGDLDRLSPEGGRYATFLFMTTVARVVPHQSTFRTTYVLDAIALGLGTTVDGKDMVLSPEKEKELGANLGFFFRLVLKGAYNKQQEVHLVARSPTFAVYDTPAMVHRRGKHVDATLRYALLVDEGTGRLDTLVWLIDRTDPLDVVPDPIEQLPPGTHQQAPLHVDSKEFFEFNIPGLRSFAADSIPQGDRQLTMSPEVKALAGQDHFTSDEALRLHQALRRLMRSAGNH